MRHHKFGLRKAAAVLLGLMILAAFAPSCSSQPKGVSTDPAVKAQRQRKEDFDDTIDKNAERLLARGRQIFRYDTFGSEAFWGDQLQLHRALVRQQKGGVGAGVTPRQALQLGLKVDSGKVPKVMAEAIKESAVNLDDPDATLALLRADAVVGVKGVFDKKDNLQSMGITCAICHSTVDDSFVKGIGERLDGWPNRDLDIGAIVALAPNLQPMAEPLGIDVATLTKVLKSWGPGKYDAEVNQDGKAFRPDGKSAATVLPAAFGLAGVNLHTYSGWGGVTHWNAYVANTQMHGKGTFFDPRLNDAERFPVAVKAGHHNVRNTP